jgi:hypothetical protein
MPAFFPRHTGAFTAQDTHAFRTITTSTVEMAVITGIVLHTYRAIVLSSGAGRGWLFLGVSLALGTVILFGLTTLHLGNYTLRQWVRRVPVFAIVEAATESLVALGLIALGREPLGSTRASVADWPMIVQETFVWRVCAIILFAVLLAGVVQLFRRVLVARDHREHTLEAVARTSAHGPESRV